MRLGIDQLHISRFRPISTPLPIPDMQLIDRARLYGLETLPAIKVRQTETGHYEILSGLITWRAAQTLRIDDMVVECLQLSDAAACEMVRADVGERREFDPITQAEMLREQIKVEGISRNTLCQRYGLSKSQLSHMLRLLQLDSKVREWVREGRLSPGKAKVLVKLDSIEQQRIAQLAVNAALNTREVEGEARNIKATKSSHSLYMQGTGKDSNTLQLEVDISEKLGNPVTINWDPASATGEISIRYFSLEELQAIIDRLQNQLI